MTTDTGPPDGPGDEFAAFADELREQAERDLVAATEGWPDDDRPDL